MDHTEKLCNAERLAEELRSYGVGMLQDASVTCDDGCEPSVRITMKDGLSFHLPWDFNPEHFDTLISVASAARIKGREEALLETLSREGTAH